MSHLHEREEKICLNCNAQLTGRFCADCGQENVEPKETVWHLFVHFFNDVTHFDGKFFSTMKPLLLKPGFLTEEYVNGRRASYLNPIRMYLFISAVFFLLLMSMVGDRAINKPTAKTPHDTRVLLDSLDDALNETDTLDKKTEGKDTIAEFGNVKITRAKRTKKGNFSNLFGGIETVHEYDSLQKALPKKEKDNFIERYFFRKVLAAAETANESDPQVLLHTLTANFFHALPKVFFISLPLFALLLMLLYVRRRKQFYYVSHAIFTVHIYCFSFIMWTLVILTSDIPYVGSIFSTLVPLVIFFYLYKAMRKFYKQGRAITILKFILMYFGISILVVALAFGLAFNAFISIAAPH